MRKMLVSGVVMAVTAVVLGVAYFGFGKEPGDLLQAVIDLFRSPDPSLWHGHRPVQVNP